MKYNNLTPAEAQNAANNLIDTVFDLQNAWRHRRHEYNDLVFSLDHATAINVITTLMMIYEVEDQQTPEETA